jgi:starch-binding outer membrane protein, SusD/RagB family
MKKYNIKKFSMLLSAIFLLSNCNDDFLERYPLDQISKENYWNVENDLLVYNNSLYDLAKDDDNVPMMMAHDEGINSRNFSIWWLDIFSDNMVSQNSRFDFYSQVRSGKQTMPTDAESQWYGYKGWEFVRAINFGLENYSRADIAQAIIDKYAGEARLFRGWFYADKVSKFGDVTWIDHILNIDSEELYDSRTPRDEVMEKVLEDLTFACEKLPNDWGDGNAPGRLNRWCALLVKSRVCLFEGTWQKYHGGTNSDMWLQEAADAAKELIENGPYSIYSIGDVAHDYSNLHRVQDLTGNSEVLYWRKYISGQYMHTAMRYFRAYVGGATKSMVEDYLCTDGLPISLSPNYMGDAQIEDVFVNRDPRLRQTILHPEDVEYFNYAGAAHTYPRLRGMSGGYLSKTGYHVIKVYDYEAGLVPTKTDVAPAITLRLGEAMLNYAEAKAELGTITQADLDISINILRDRVGMPHMNLNNIAIDPRYLSDGVSPLIVEIRRERRVELYMEGFRYNDLRRWKQGKKLESPDLGILWDKTAIARYPKANVKTTIDPVSGKTYVDVYQGTDWENPVFNEARDYLWPIPLEVISQNTNITQNPNWGN